MWSRRSFYHEATAWTTDSRACTGSPGAAAPGSYLPVPSACSAVPTTNSSISSNTIACQAARSRAISCLDSQHRTRTCWSRESYNYNEVVLPDLVAMLPCWCCHDGLLVAVIRTVLKTLDPAITQWRTKIGISTQGHCMLITRESHNTGYLRLFALTTDPVAVHLSKVL